MSGGAIVVAVNQTPRLGDHAAFELTASGAGPLWLPFSCQGWYRQEIEFGLFRLPKSEDGRCKSQNGIFRSTRKSAFDTHICRFIVTVIDSNSKLEEFGRDATSMCLFELELFEGNKPIHPDLGLLIVSILRYPRIVPNLYCSSHQSWTYIW